MVPRVSCGAHCNVTCLALEQSRVKSVVVDLENLHDWCCLGNLIKFDISRTADCNLEFWNEFDEQLLAGMWANDVQANGC